MLQCLEGLSGLFGDECLPAPKLVGLKMGRVLGSGSFALVRKAQLPSGDDCAVKSLQRWAERSATSDLTTEAALMGVVQHENIVKLIRTVTDGPHTHLVMEFCHGRSLYQVLKQDGAVPEADARSAMWQCLLALEHLQKHHVAHRDLKTANVLLKNEGGIEGNIIKVTDFGLAASYDATEARPFQGGPDEQGTALYCAPEMFRGPYGAECDMWSAGVMLFILLSNARPFDSDASKRFASPRYGFADAAWSTISGQAKDLIIQLLEPEVSQRLTARESLEATWFDAKFGEPDTETENTMTPSASRVSFGTDISMTPREISMTPRDEASSP